MEYHKISKLLNEESHSKFVIKKWDIVDDLPNVNYEAGNGIIYNTEVLKSKLCDYNDVFILVLGYITFIATPCN